MNYVEAMKLALEALEQCAEIIDGEWGSCRSLAEMDETNSLPKAVRGPITALRTAIAEAEKQEPVCAMCKSTHGRWSWMCDRCLLIHDKQPPAAQPAAEKQEPVACPDCFGSEFPGTIRGGWRCKTCDGTAYVDAPAAQPAAPEDWRDLVLMALPNYVPQEDWLLSPGASLMSEDSHEMMHWDTIEKIVKAVAAPPAAQRQPLTDEEFAIEWYRRTGRITGGDKMLLLQAKYVTEAAHGITGDST